MNSKDLIRLGVPMGEATRRGTDFIAQYVLGGGDKSRIEAEVKAVVANPALFAEDPLRKEFAKAIVNSPPPARTEPAKYRQWGEGLESEAINQMENACFLPVSVAGALMPDAHVGYGLPIRGVLATDNCVIPYAVGVDIACRMKMTVLDIPVRDLEHKQDRLERAIAAETRFGVGSTFKDRRQHDVLDADCRAARSRNRIKIAHGHSSEPAEVEITSLNSDCSRRARKSMASNRERTSRCSVIAEVVEPVQPFAITTASSR